MREESPAFRQALLRSERLRLRIVIAAVAVAFVSRSLRTIILFSRENFYIWLITSLFLVAFLAYELLMLRAVNGLLRSGRNLPRAAWVCNNVVETCIPAFALVVLSSGSIDTPYKPLANPALLFYVVFLILSTLRLDPWACRISGIVAGVSYLLAAAYLGWTFRFTATSSILSPERAVISFALTFVVCGFVAGAVAGEIRKQVEAALREAETKRQVERLEHDLQIARSIQQSLLPTSQPQIAGFQVAGWSRSADDTGGDFYDWKQLPDGRWAVILADVTGHGIGPAMLASVCRAYSRASFNVRESLKATLKNINHSFAEDLTPDRFATFVAAVCQGGSDQVELLSAGHGPLFIYDAHSRSFQYLEAQALPLGILPEMDDAALPVKLKMKPGDMVLLITDGFFEWENPGEEQFGTERLAEIVRRNSDQDPGIIIAQLYQSVLTFSQGTPQKDDLTAVLIKRVAAETNVLQPQAAD
jgi:serine phosphatase RsbU (regulator of sigma subunit)